ncbi:hypothetical protein [Actinoplanes sp. NPDC051859]|uniref:hypothetical protein n=1 Tax=Actinoplanes sp. NPDC051859 TaxID=3363909 RepID=UPI00378E3625
MEDTAAREPRRTNLARRTPGAAWRAARRDPGGRKLTVNRAPSSATYAADEATLLRLRDGLLGAHRPEQPPRS